jgi:hypothetical protein
MGDFIITGKIATNTVKKMINHKFHFTTAGMAFVICPFLV